MIVKLNGAEYAVGVASVSRSIRRSEKYRVTTEDGIIHREVRASYLDFSLSLGNLGSADYDRMVAMLHRTVGDITVELPSSSTASETYTGVFDTISDEVITEDEAGVKLWDNLTLAFTGTVPLPEV